MTVTNLIFWVLLGGVVGMVRQHFIGAAANPARALPDRNSLTFLLGGARSGKSAHAETLVVGHPAPWAYIATAQAYDDEMAERIALHRDRRGEGWETVDAPLDLAGALRAVPDGRPVLVDCLTLWLSNHLLAEHDLEAASGDWRRACRAARAVVRGFERGRARHRARQRAGRQFRDAQGRLNQRIAARADHVLFMVAGLPLKVK